MPMARDALEKRSKNVRVRVDTLQRDGWGGMAEHNVDLIVDVDLGVVGDGDGDGCVSGCSSPSPSPSMTTTTTTLTTTLTTT